MTAHAISVILWNKHVVRDASLDIGRNQVTALVGPSGCGKATFLRCLNRSNDYVENCLVSGTIMLGGKNIQHPDVDVGELRTKIGMVYKKPNPFPISIFENIAHRLRIHDLSRSHDDLEEIVFDSLEKVGLLKDIKDRLAQPGMGLSTGQQQLLCIARVLALEPEVILMDKPCLHLDQNATARIEELIDELRRNFTIVIVTDPMQAARVSQRVAYFHLGKIVECGPTSLVITNPAHWSEQKYVTPRVFD